MSLFHHSTPADRKLNFFPPPNLSQQHPNLSTCLGFRLAFSSAICQGLGQFVGFRLSGSSTPFTDDGNTTFLFSCFFVSKKHFSGLVNSEKTTTKNGRGRLGHGKPLCHDSLQKKLGWASRLDDAKPMVPGRTVMTTLLRLIPPVEGNKTCTDHRRMWRPRFRKIAKCLYMC